MVDRIEQWLAQGLIVKIFTARVARDEPEASDVAEIIQDWLELHGLPRLEVTCRKDMYCLQLWDDRAIGVVPNSGLPIGYTNGVNFEFEL